MSRAMIIGAGGVAGVVINKCCQNSDVFTEIMIASRTKAKCDAFKEKLQPTTKTVITTAQVDADNVEELTALIKSYNPEIVINVALPYQDLHIMDACLAAGVNYLDTANYEPEDTAKFEYSWQWAYRERFEKAGLTAILGCGFDPGVTGVFSAYAMKHQFDEINYIDILDCNGGDHGYPFATNFNPEINIREVSANGSYIEDGKWVETKPMEIKRVYNFKGVGEKDMYLLHHEELESLALNIKGIKRIRFFMTFGQSYLTHLKCLEDVGMTSIKPIMYEGKEIVPLQFLKAVLPDPASLGPTITTDKPQVTTPAQTVRTDLPKVTAEPQYTTAATTTTKPAKQTEPAEIQTDANDFPANPEVNQTFVDSTGTEYIYNGIFGWIQGNDGNPDVQEFPDNYGEIGSGNKILH